MDLNQYIDVFGNTTFLERPFNDVDALILAQLSYINFELVAPKIDELNRKPFLLKNINAREIKKLADGELTTSQNEILLIRLKTSLRFRQIGVCYIKIDSSLETDKQFYGLTLVLPTGEHYISYRGTDLTLVGWKEDCNLAFLDTIPAQICAIKYLDEVTKLFDGPFYLGGHSKGGNLSFYAALHQSDEEIARCITAYSFDGPGFYEKDYYENETYKKIEDKLVKIVPKDSLIGIMLNHTKHARVVDANSLSVMQHNPYNWKIDPKTGDFKYLKKRANQSYINERALSTWLNSMTKEEISMTINCLFELLGGTNKNLYHLLKHAPQTINNFNKVSQNYSKEQKQKLVSILKRLFYYHKKARAYVKAQAKQTKKDKGAQYA